MHASTASVALLLGAHNLIRRPRGDRRHLIVGRVWLACMYVTVLSSFAIQALHPGHFTWIHGLSVFTLVTLTIGLWAARTHRAAVHGQFMAGSYFGLVGAFIGAVVVPQRRIPQLALHHPVVLAAATIGVIAVAAAIVHLARTGTRIGVRAVEGTAARDRRDVLSVAVRRDGG
ncbi:MAG TPA: DUF2306 domain-containing protein [Streptosporangiaceae bacterium]|nr:DUF2306 domain-containing protein [Streptosporangiaceae bacterium]